MFSINTNTIAAQHANEVIELDGAMLTLTNTGRDLQVTASALNAFLGAEVDGLWAAQEYINSQLDGADSLEVEECMVTRGADRQRLYAITGSQLLYTRRLVITRA